MASVDAVNAEICAYKFTVEAIACVKRAFKDLAGARLRQGPRMRTAGGTVVTPDMTLEVEGWGGAGYRAVGEVKSSFPKYRAAVDQMVRQVRHYDGDLVGWTADMQGGGDRRIDHDIIITVGSEHALDFAAGLPVAFRDRGVEVKSPLSIISIMYRGGDDDPDQFLLKRSFGTISHKKAHDGLGKGWLIDEHEVMKEVDGTKFYDSKPPLPYIMSVLWSQVFPNILHGKKLKAFRIDMEVPIDMEVDRIHRLASRLAPSSNPGCVKRAWVKDAMEEFARVGLAEKTGKGRYRIRYSAHESRPAEWFARMTARGEGNTGDPNRSRK